MATLYVVATPIGNLGDITQRALEVLARVAVIAAEDTRHSRALLTHFGIRGKTLRALHAHSNEADVAALVEVLATKDIALLSDAGTPLVSDPGDALVRAAIEHGHPVVPLPGPSAVLAALVASGLGGASFRFVGFLPRDGSARHAALERCCETPESVVLFESPSRLAATLRELADRQPGRRACVSRELTKLHEEHVRGPLHELAEETRPWRGEIVLTLGPYAEAQRTAAPSAELVDARIDAELHRGTHPKTIAEMLATWSGRPKRELYTRVVERKRG